MVLFAVVTMASTAWLSAPPRAEAEPAQSAEPPTASPSSDKRSLRTDERARILGREWRAKPDRAVITVGDSSGFHVMVGDSANGYAWRTVASLSEPGMETNQWIGNACVTGSGKRAVVVYAPSHFANRAYLADRGAFAAVVNLDSGAVRKLSVTSSLAYFNPGCGTGESAVLTQGGGDDLNKTRLTTVDVESGRLGKPIVVKGQVTSPVPTTHGIIAAANGALVQVHPSGSRTVVAETQGVPYRLAADDDGGLVFLQRTDDNQSEARRVTALTPGVVPQTVATGELTEIGVTSSRGGRVFITGDTRRPSAGIKLPPSVEVIDAERNATIAANGSIGVTKVDRPTRLPKESAPDSPADTAPVDITATSMATGKEFALTATPVPTGGDGVALSPALVDAAAAGDPNDPADDALRTCAVPRNDPRNQAMQPMPRQVEWAVNDLVKGRLNVDREANWKNLGMAAYNVTNMFPERPLVGGGRVPAQVLLGIALAESNLSQAAWYAVPGVTSNPLIGNYYGVGNREDPIESWEIDFAQADCGYGVMQITDGMRKSGAERPEDAPALPYAKQRAVALDFAANLAEGERILANKWNATKVDGLKLNQGQTWALENWFYALWAYNSGYYPRSESGNNAGAWGVGWFNNPINPRYDISRPSFLYNAPEHGRTPQLWPYPERALGYAANPLHLIESPGVTKPAYRPATWATNSFKIDVKPPVGLFCEEDVNSCSESNARQGLEPCMRSDFRCWFNQPATWKQNCDGECGQEFIRFGPEQYPYQPDGTAYEPNCSLSGLPSNALIVDDVPSSISSARPNCSKQFSNAGSFHFAFSGADGKYPSKVDLHQLGTGFDGHIWMGNSYRTPAMKVSGTWTFNQAGGSWARILVHLPVVGSRTQQARYEIDVEGNGTFTKSRYINQDAQRNGWVSLGVHRFAGTPRVRLSNTTDDGKGTERVAWDAIALQRLSKAPDHIVAVLGDSYISGEGAGAYSKESDANHGTHRWNACRRSANSWPRKLVLPGASSSLGSLSDQYHPNYELASVACSGAENWNVSGKNENGTTVVPRSWNRPEDYELGEGQFHEVAQVNSGVLDSSTTLVFVSVGGNDEEAFTKALIECLAAQDCSTNIDFFARYRSTMSRTQTRIEQTLKEIGERAPNALIVMAGYPRLFRPAASCSNALVDTETSALADLADYMADRQKQAVDNVRFHPVWAIAEANPISAFTGHGACDSTPWIHHLRDGPLGEGDFHQGDRPSKACIIDDFLCVSRESFHPNAAGTTGYASFIQQRLNSIPYPSD